MLYRYKVKGLGILPIKNIKFLYNIQKLLNKTKKPVKKRKNIHDKKKLSNRTVKLSLSKRKCWYKIIEKVVDCGEKWMKVV